jgi:hypothetical protein
LTTDDGGHVQAGHGQHFPAHLGPQRRHIRGREGQIDVAAVVEALGHPDLSAYPLAGSR